MSYEVFWVPDAEDELTRLWLDADDRDAVTSAADMLDADLRVRPNTLGESRGGTRRVHFESPLIVIFEVDDPDRRVRVLKVGRRTS